MKNYFFSLGAGVLVGIGYSAPARSFPLHPYRGVGWIYLAFYRRADPATCEDALENWAGGCVVAFIRSSHTCSVISQKKAAGSL